MTRVCYVWRMKKTTTRSKLQLKPETVKTLGAKELANIIGGVTVGHGCAQPTTTLVSLDRC
jgi:bacteriocin-like protein